MSPIEDASSLSGVYSVKAHAPSVSKCPFGETPYFNCHISVLLSRLRLHLLQQTFVLPTP
jgi:hypothetical protein